MNNPHPSRRRFIGIMAAAAAYGAMPWAAPLAAQTPAPATWRGIALGADAQLRIYHPDPGHAQALIEMSIAEVHRLEKIFSLYQEDSALSRLNRDGFIAVPDGDMLTLLQQARILGDLTQGAFDITVQPLWELYADYFSRHIADQPGPTSDAISRALRSVDYRAVQLDASRIQLMRPDMKLTLNGIAQGYITDRVVQLLANAGLERALVDMGEIRGLARTPSSPPWRAGLADPMDATHIFDTVQLRNQALATSSAYGTPISPTGQVNHLFDPRTGRSPERYRSVSVLAPTAAMADGLSTAFSAMALETTQDIVRSQNLRAWFVLPDGSVVKQA